MGDRGRQLPHGRDSIDMGELHLRLAVAPLALAQLLLRPLALGDVLDSAEHVAAPARPLPCPTPPTIHEPHPPIWPNPPVFPPVGLRAPPRPPSFPPRP